MNTNDRALFEAKNVAAKLATLVGDERKVLVAFLRHLIEFDQKRHYAKLGHGSLFTYCTDELRLSIGSTSRRMTAARLMARFPVIADFLADGRLTLVSLSFLRNVLTQENHLEVLREAGKRTEKEVEVLAATLQPKPDTVDSIRKLPTPKREAPTLSMDLASAPAVKAPAAPLSAAVPAPSTVNQPTVTSIMEVNPGKPDVRRAPRMEVHPTSAEAYSVKLSVSSEFVDEFKQVKAALSHKFPNGRFEDVLRECFRITLEVLERRRIGSSRASARSVAPAVGASEETCEVSVEARRESKRPSKGTRAATTDVIAVSNDAASMASSQRTIAACGTAAASKSRYIPAAVRRAVWKRDGGSCAFVSADGKRCASTHRLQFHHVEPFATGGPSTVENLRLHCAIHNHHEAVAAFGAEFMKAHSARRL